MHARGTSQRQPHQLEVGDGLIVPEDVEELQSQLELRHGVHLPGRGREVDFSQALVQRLVLAGQVIYRVCACMRTKTPGR